MSQDSTETDYKVGQDNITPFGLDIHNPVFLISGIAIVAFVIITLMFQQGSAEFFAWLRPAITSTFDWFFLSAGNFFVIFALVVCISPLGRVRLGGQDASPDYSYVGWFSMLFAAGMGIGLMFFGVSEPMSHFGSSMGGIAVGENGIRTDWAPLGAAAGDVEAATRLAMAATIYHWGLHPWAMYAVVALALAFFSFNNNLPLTLRSAFYPLLGEKVWGWAGHLIDTIAVFATLFGLATSLGFGTQQALAGFNFLYDWGTGHVAIVLLITFITAIAIGSVVRGLDGGVKVLSEVNMGLALLLLAFIFFVGPTGDIVSTMFSGAAAYVVEFIPLSMPFGREDANFSQGWTSFYWAWWISWSPFVGMFIARVSRGRSVREFLICVILVPTVLCILWMATFGGTALSQVIADAAAPVGAVAQEIKLFHMLNEFPLTGVLSLIGIILVLVFFVTSSDSGSLVIDTITAGGKTDAPVSQRVFWCSFEGLVAAVLLLVGGAEALGALQAMAVSTGLPFTIVLLTMCVSLWIGLSKASKEI
ncbi:MAG: BCCT family transporter [Gammaproteobacteria bacterium]|nr:BCCT family transporter [Gammaproteobacteria bacterium]